MTQLFVPYPDLTSAARTQLLDYYSNFFSVSKMTIEDWIKANEVLINPNDLKIPPDQFADLEDFILNKQG
jgi:hypothetical protein